MIKNRVMKNNLKTEDVDELLDKVKKAKYKANKYDEIVEVVKLLKEKYDLDTKIQIMEVGKYNILAKKVLDIVGNDINE